MTNGARSSPASADLPLALLAVAFLLWLGFQTLELVRESQTLAAITRSQDAPLQDAARLRQAAESLAGDTAQLAESGNPGAKAVVDELAKLNVNLHPPAAPASPAAGAAPLPATEQHN
jgi:hypothetical protein